MIINEWDNFIITDNVLTNLPISRLSSIPAGVDGMAPEDLFLISRPCEPSEMTDTGYMSYKTDLDSLSAWMYGALGLPGLQGEVDDILLSVSYFNEFYGMLCRIRDANPSVVVETYDSGKFNPLVISAVTQLSGVITDIGGYRFATAMSNIFGWKKFSEISAVNGYFDNLSAGGISADGLSAGGISAGNLNVTGSTTSINGVFQNLSAASRLSAANLTSTRVVATGLTATNANITNLSVGGQPYQHLSVMTQNAYNSAVKKANYFYFTYPG